MTVLKKMEDVILWLKFNKGLNVIHRKVDKGYTIWYCYSDENQKLGVIGKVERRLTQEEKTAFTADVRRFFLGTGIHNNVITDVCTQINSRTVGIMEINQFQIGMRCDSDTVEYTHGNYTTELILSCPLRQYIEKRKFFVTWYGKEREIKTTQAGTLEGIKYD